ncbi:hypothetical protein ITJ64_04535 [Herbiconiux sp. VKM Ac-1786]|uniref:hypothetical protein n=1 Tax=Herbiconiux sp. VKM Ac-1786 TaxID=2783824 RepID=UPI00188B1B97|nr:hypothetical protein [Herbiconiux sp. VKM Ac-1786]MBF4571775.1 hypothetical protein [Herbiconiux sp. VKM Ac-1786]
MASNDAAELAKDTAETLAKNARKTADAAAEKARDAADRVSDDARDAADRASDTAATLWDRAEKLYREHPTLVKIVAAIVVSAVAAHLARRMRD